MGVGNCGAMNPCSRKLADTLGARTGPRGNRDDLPRRPLRRSFIELPASSQRRSGTSSDLARTGPSVEPAPAVSDLMSDAFAQARSEQGRTTAGPEAIAPVHADRFDDATMEATFNCGVGLVLVVASVSADVLGQRACASRSARSRAERLLRYANLKPVLVRQRRRLGRLVHTTRNVMTLRSILGWERFAQE